MTAVSFRRSGDLLGPALTALAEGAWIAALYVVVELTVDAERSLGIGAFAGAAGVGMVIGARTRVGPDRSALLVGVLLVAGVAGWLLTGSSLASLAALDLRGAVAHNPGGLLLSLALLRGILRGRSLGGDGAGDLGLGGPAVALAACWVLGGALAEPRRTLFASESLGPTIAFLVAGPGGAAITRVAALGRRGGVAWTANRAWFGLLAGCLLVAAGIALIAATNAMDAIRVVAPLILVAAIAIVIIREPAPAHRPTDRRRTAVAWLVLLTAIALVTALPRAKPLTPTDVPSGPAVVDDEAAASRQGGTLLVIAGLALTSAVVILVLRRRGVRRPAAASGLDEDHEVKVDWSGVRERFLRSRPAPPAKPGAPRGAVAAYRAALRELSIDPVTRRGWGETPAEHAGRLRRDGAGGLALELLAADYAVARFAGHEITDPENRRAVGRWARIRAEARRRAEASEVARLARAVRDGEDGAADKADARDEATKSREGRV